MSIEKYFDNNWKNTKLSEEKKEQIEIILYFMNHYIKQDSLNYFEFGCGNCYVTNFLFSNLKNNYKDIKFHVSDISKVGLSHCDNNFKKTLVTKEKMSFVDLYSSMDIVTSFEVFEHLDDDLHSFYSNELLKISKKYLLIGLPYQETLEKRNVVCNACGYDGHVYGHLRSYDINKFSNLFGKKAKLLEYKLCGSIETDLNRKNYSLAKKLKIKNLKFTCPNCINEQNEISYLNRIYNKLISSFILNTKFYRTDIHPFWVVGIFEKVDNNEKK